MLAATVPFDFPAIQLGDEINYAIDVITGDQGSSQVLADPAKSASPLEGIQETADSDFNIISGTSADEAADADFVIVVAGLNAKEEGEEYTGAGDRATFDLDGKMNGTPQNDLIFKVSELDKPMGQKDIQVQIPPVEGPPLQLQGVGHAGRVFHRHELGILVLEITGQGGAWIGNGDIGFGNTLDEAMAVPLQGLARALLLVASGQGRQPANFGFDFGTLGREPDLMGHIGW